MMDKTLELVIIIAGVFVIVLVIAISFIWCYGKMLEETLPTLE